MRNIDLIVIHRTEVGRTGKEVSQNEPGAYQLFIGQSGSVEWAMGGGFDLGFELRGAHAIGYNTRSIGIALYGCFDVEPDGKPLVSKPRNLHPTKAQMDALELVCQGLCWWLGKKLALAGHTELPGATVYAGKRCPGRNLDMDVLRRRVGLNRPV